MNIPKLTAILVLFCATIASAQTKSEFFTTSDGVRIHYLEAGHGPVMMLIPGWTMPADIWENQLAYFSRSYHVIAVDPRSQGESDKATDGNYPERRARDYRELMQSLELPPAVLVGWSMAVPDLMAYVDQFGAAQIRGLVLVDGMAIMDESVTKMMPMFLRAVQMDRSRFTESFVKSMYKKPQTDAYLGRIVNASLKTPTSHAVAMQVGALGHPDWSATLAKLTDVPVLYIGEPAMKKQAAAIAEKLPSMKIEIFEESGHAIFVDEADRFDAVLEKFLLSLR